MGGYDVRGEGGMVEQTLAELTGQRTRELFMAECHPERICDLLSYATREGPPTVVCTYGRAERPGVDELEAGVARRDKLQQAIARDL